MLKMVRNEQNPWLRVKTRLRTIVGEDVYSSWFARVEIESINGEVVHLSVPTRFLKSWIQSQYLDRVLSCWQAEESSIRRVELSVRTPMRSPAPATRDAKAANDERSRSETMRSAARRSIRV
jgi:chromosomal replication initiator protein